MEWRTVVLKMQPWLWKVWITAAAISFLDALSILIPGVFGWANFAHHTGQHAVISLAQGMCCATLGFVVRRRSPRIQQAPSALRSN
jgi:hypothetical protein